MDGLLKDIRFALKSLLRSPAFSVVSVLTLGLGIGMSVAVWSVIDAVLIRPLPYPESDRLVIVGLTLPDHGTTGYPMSALDYFDYVERNQSFESMSAFFRDNLNITGGSMPERVSGALVSAGFFEVFRSAPQLGRGFRAEEDAPGGDPVAVISHPFWQRRFGGDQNVIGDTITVNGQRRAIVGVAPRGFDFPHNIEVWLPFSIEPAEEDRAHGWVTPIGRLRPGIEIDEAVADLGTINAWIEREHPDADQGRIVAIQPLKERLVGDARQSLLVLLQESPELGLAMLGSVSLWTRKLASKLELLTQRRVEERLAIYLLARTGGEELGPGDAIALAEPRNLIAAQCGTAPEVLSRTFRRLEEDGLLTAEQRQVIVHRPDDLRRLAEHLD